MNTNTTIKTEVKIYQDQFGDSPRNWDNLGTIIYNHKNYNLGDQEFNSDLYTNWLDVLKGEVGKLEELVYLPVYLYDHSDITINTTGFNCQWDSGQVGWIYVSKEDIRKEFGVKRITKELIEDIKKQLKGEINTFDLYIRGEVYGFRILEDGEEIDGCGDILGEFEDLIEYIISGSPSEEVTRIAEKLTYEDLEY